MSVLNLRKNVKKRKKKIEDEKTEHVCDTRTHDVIRRNFEKRSSREINL